MPSRWYILANNINALHTRYLALIHNETKQDILDIMEAMYFLINAFHFSYDRSRLLIKYGWILETSYEIVELSYSNIDECYALLYRLYTELKN